MSKRVWLVIIVLVVAALACGSATPVPTISTAIPAATEGAAEATSPPSAAATATPAPAWEMAKVGDRVEVSGVALTVASMKSLTVISQFIKPQTEGDVFVVADVLLENTGADKTPYNFFYFKVKDADDFVYNVTVGPEPSLKSGDLAAGDKVRGNVAFEVKATSKGLVLTYEPIIVGNTITLSVFLGDAPTPEP